jgi:flagellar hook-basal body complex protein FliE
MATNGTNGSTTTQTPADPKLVDSLHAQWVAAGSKKPDQKTAKTLVAAWKAAQKEQEAAEEAYKKAMAKTSAAVSAIVVARGKGRVEIDGIICTPMSRGETVYFRKESKEAESFG